jgi:hypothetical protein
MNHTLLRGVLGFFAAVALMLGQETRVLAGSTGEITGKITDATTKAPIAGASVTAASPTGVYKATTNAQGFFAIVSLYPDTYRLTVSAAGYLTAMSDGNTVNQNNSTTVDISLSKETTVLGHVTVRGAMTVVQPTVTAQQYVLTSAAADATNGSGGSYGLYQTPGIIGTLPGVTLDAGGYSHIRGSRLEEVGYEYDGLTTVEPITGTFSTNLVEDGIARLQVSTGGYDASGGNAISGEVNTVVGVGSYPPHGSFTSLIQSPSFYHGLNFDYGSATPDGRFSWYAAAVMWNSDYDWGKRGTFNPGPMSSETAFGGGPLGSVIPSRDEVLNLHYKFGTNFSNDLQVLTTTGIEHYNNGILPQFYASSNPVDGPPAVSPNVVPSTGLCDNNVPLFPGQISCTQIPGPGTTDHDDQGYFIDKVQLTHNFSSNSTLNVHYARVGSYVTFSYPFGDGPFADFWENRHSDQQEAFAEYTVQANSQNLLKLGGDTIYSTNYLLEALPSSGVGIVIPTNNRDKSYWIADNFKPNEKLTLDISGRRDQRTYYRVTDSLLTEAANQLRGGIAYQVNQSTVLRGSDGNFVELPYMSRVEELETFAPNYADYSPGNLLANIRAGANPGISQNHSYDYSLEHDFGHGMAMKVGPFYRKTDDLVLTFRQPGQAHSLPQAVGPYLVNGFEGEFQFNNVGNGVSGYINYTHTRAQASVTGDYAQTLSPGAKMYGALFPVAFVPPNVANLVLTFRRAKWSINPEINWYGGYPYGVGRKLYNNRNCPTGSGGGDPTQPCGAIVSNPAAYQDTDPATGLCGPGFCTVLNDPNESLFADGRVCCSTLTANLNIYYKMNALTTVGMQWQNLNQNYRAIALEQNPYFPTGFNGFFSYGTSPYIPASINTAQEFLFSVTQKI